MAVSRAAADRRADADGHEYCGIVEEVGSAVKSIKPSQFVIGSFAISDNTCPNCQHGYQSSCVHREFMNRAQAPVLRVPLADGTLVPTPGAPSNDLLPSLLTTSDVLGTGWFAADAANVKPGSTVAVVGDGAVALLGVLSAKQMHEGGCTSSHVLSSFRPTGGNLMMRALFSALTPLALALAAAIVSARAEATDATAQTARGMPDQQVSTMKIRMDVEGTAVTATLVDSATSRDFVSLLPLTLSLTDYAGTEKISDLPRRLSTEGAPDGSDPSVGDIAYYAPWGNLAIFYRDFGYSRGLVQLGKIDSGVEVLSGSDPLPVTIELIKE